MTPLYSPQTQGDYADFLANSGFFTDGFTLAINPYVPSARWGWLWQALNDTSNPALQTFPTANRAFYQPCVIPRAITITGYGLASSTTSASFSVALYDIDANGDPNSRVTNAASVSTTANVYSSATVTNVQIEAGMYWLGVANDSAADTVMAFTIGNVASNGLRRAAGIRFEDSAFPLPASATPDTTNDTATKLVPVAGIEWQEV